jgi:hypothetical protein
MHETKTFYIYYEYLSLLAAAELSRISSDIFNVDQYPHLQNNIIYYFNRLIVPKKLRHKNIASVLMSRVCFWADEHHISILNDVNPYGDLDLEQLEQLKQFYKKYNFTELIKNTNTLIRHPKDFAVIRMIEKRKITAQQLRTIAIELEKTIKCNCDPLRSLLGPQETGHYWQCNIHLEAVRILYGTEPEFNDDL